MKSLALLIVPFVLFLTAVACATAAPTAAPFPTVTPTPAPTATPVPTATARPTPTATPRPPLPIITPWPKTTPTPTPAVKWGLPYNPVPIGDLAKLKLERTSAGPFILRGCYAGIAEHDGTTFTLSDSGNLSKASKIAQVRGFAEGTLLFSPACYNMAVQFEWAATYCYYRSPFMLPPAFSGDCPGFTARTPVFHLVNPSSFEKR